VQIPPDIVSNDQSTGNYDVYMVDNVNKYTYLLREDGSRMYVTGPWADLQV